MSIHQVEIHQTGPAYRVLVDGVDVARHLDSLTFEARAGLPPRLRLEIDVVDVTTLGSVETEVVLGGGAHEALVALGWTPPAG
ncbi:hypothetical protein ACWENO_13795 [Streptomyces sp. NPDC004436]